MERITATHALSVGFRAVKARPLLLGGIGLSLAGAAICRTFIDSLWGDVVGLLFSLGVLYPLQSGLDLVCLDTLRQRETGPRAFLGVGRRWGSLAIAAAIRYAPLIVTTLIFGRDVADSRSPAWLLLPLSVAGIIISLIFTFAPILLLDRGNPIATSEPIGLRAALRHSAQLTRARKGTLFAIPLLASIPFLGIALIGVIVLAIAGIMESGFFFRPVPQAIITAVSGAFFLPWISASTMLVFDQATAEHPDVAEPIEYEVLGTEDAD